ncbi:MAG: hypothetical protein A2Z30_06980 [Chloroflexi bacterium RBG_16_64_43]|nr:MAG: hypothetical protein A2Z30_06980 [Chloroflexi bacterium RBG_16_64_43]
MKKWMLALAAMALLLGACASAAMRNGIVESVAPAAPSEFGRADLAYPALDAGNVKTGAEAQVSGSAASADRIVLRNASRTLVVNDPAKTAEEIGALTVAAGGFVVNSYIYETTYAELDHPVNQGNITVRVPAEKLDAMLKQFEALAVEVRSRNISGQDVTAEYTDLQSRLRNLQAAEAQLREILASATKTEDVMYVFNQLTQIRSEIEVLQGQIRYYEESAAYAAISVELLPFIPTQPLQIGGWHPTGTARQALQSLIRGLQNLVDLLIYVGICGIPLLVVFGLPLFFIIRWAARRSRKGKSAPSA